MYNKLKKVNVSDNTEMKGKFTYLSWTWAWDELMKVAPHATYEILPVEYHQDGSATVFTKMTISEVTHTMFLPVMNFSNKAIANPDAFDINKARMRCLVKNIAMFGLGLYIYAGEDLPEADSYEDICEQHADSINAIKEAIASDDLSTASEAWFELSDDSKKSLWKAPTKGGCFTVRERDVMKSQEFRLANGRAAA